MAADPSRDKELFDVLPEQIAPDRPVQDKPRLRKAERRQVKLRAICLDDLIPADHRVRMVWRFVEGLDLSQLLAEIKAVEGQAGHPPADPRIMVALWLYATTEGVGSAREVARLCDDHIGYHWLCGGVGMNATTLSDFRVGHGQILECLLIDSFTALVKAGVASLGRVAQDGVRVRASAGAASFRRDSTLQECRHEAEKAVRNLRAELVTDPAASNRRQAAARQRAAEERESRVLAALAVTEELLAQQTEKARKEAEREAARMAKKGTDKSAEGEPVNAKPKECPKEPRASTTDAQARVMKMPDGGFRPARSIEPNETRYPEGLVARPDTRGSMSVTTLF